MIQIALAFFGLTAMFMAMGHNARARRWAPVVGLCGQQTRAASCWRWACGQNACPWRRLECCKKATQKP